MGEVDLDVKRLSTDSKRSIYEGAKSACFADDVPDKALDTVIEVNENFIENDKPVEIGDFIEIPPRIFSKKDILPPNLSITALNTAIYELGVINLCWPEIKEPVFETRTCFPPSYYTNTPKERLLLTYAESFRRQFQYNYRHLQRKPLLLQAPNECGLQKMVCTSIRPTKLCFAGTNTWEGLASLVGDYFEYEPLQKPMLHPERLMSPYTALRRRKANPFEIATVLVSWLIGANYDAYVVIGCAKRDTCLHIRYRTECPDVPDETPVVEEEQEEEEEPRYKLVPLPDFTSKYLAQMEEREREIVRKAEAKREKERRAKIAELEKPPEDECDEWRTHAWVLILPGPMGVEEPFFIEPAEGNAYPLDASQYQFIDALYNHENYYANLQILDVQKIEETSVQGYFRTVGEDENLSHLSYDLGDTNCWEHLLAGEPMHRRILVGIDVADKRTAVETEKHLDMPASWVEKLDIGADDFSQRYPGFHKVIHYKKVLLEKFSRYSQATGIIKRVKLFADYALTVPLITWEDYSNRDDKMYRVRIDHVKQTVEQNFLDGRIDYLLKHSYSFNAPPTSVEGNHTLEFKSASRNDCLQKIVCTAFTFDEYYENRDDLLESRMITYSEPAKGENKRQLKDIVETYQRNPKIEAKDDVWKRIFHTQEETIELLYHYGYNFITNNTRHYFKPNLAETGGKILFFPDKTSGYIADPNGKTPRPLNVYYTLCENMDWEYKTCKHIREIETDINAYLRLRYKELTEPTLYVSLFSTEMNLEAQKAFMEQERLKAEIAEREKEVAIDPLTPYLARMFGDLKAIKEPLSIKDATLVREQCINDFRAKQLARQIMVQERFDKLNEEYKNKRLWYLANQFILTPAKEAAYFTLSAELAFQVHSLEVRLTRHMDLSAPRYKVLEQYLDKHPLLKEYNYSVRTHYRSKGQSQK